MKRMTRPIVLLGVLAMAGCTLHLDRATTLKSGFPHGSVYSVDGDVRVEPSAHVRKISVVDGDILLGNWAHASGLRSVDGRIKLDPGVICTGNVQSINGRITLAEGVRIEGDVRTLTASIDADNAFIGGQLVTVAGRVRLTGATHVAKGILLPKPDPHMTVNNHEERRLPELVIGPGVVIEGPIVAERGSVLKVSRQAKIGEVRGVSVQWFDGAAPPLEHRAEPSKDGTSTVSKTYSQAVPGE
ncbi:MAG: hypothetical protein ABI268_09310 [Rhodanobacter sp.]